VERRGKTYDKTGEKVSLKISLPKEVCTRRKGAGGWRGCEGPGKKKEARKNTEEVEDGKKGFWLDNSHVPS